MVKLSVHKWSTTMEKRVRIIPKRTNKHPNSHWRWWQTLGVGVFSFGIFGVLFSLIPSFSITAVRIGILLAIIGTLTGIWNWWTYSWWARFAVMVIWSLFLFGITIRAWMGIVSDTWAWLVPLLIAFILGWTLPIISPALSDFLWQEQTTPQTRTGRTLLAIGISIAPAAGAIGASIGMFGSRFGEIKGTLLILAILGTITNIVLPFIISYQLWPDRPWVKKGIEERS